MSGGPIQAPRVTRFLNLVRRRLAVIRVAESIALALAAASALGLVLTPILWWRGQSGVGPDIAILGLGAFCGLVWGISRRPTTLETAAEADRQLGLHDLLATVLLLQHKGDEGLTTSQWQQTVAATAEARCANLRPSAIVAARLNLRAWGGIGISTALLLTLGMLSSRPIELRAAESSEDVNSASAAAVTPEPQATVLASQQSELSPGRPAASNSAQDEASRDFPQDQPTELPADKSLSTSVRGPSLPGDADHDGVGAGIGRGHANFPPDKLAANSRDNSHSTGEAKAAGGNGVQVTDGTAGAAPAHSGIVTPAHTGEPSPPWDSAHWADDQNAAQSAIEDGRVPDSDQDLVRDYFQRD